MREREREKKKQNNYEGEKFSGGKEGFKDPSYGVVRCPA